MLLFTNPKLTYSHVFIIQNLAHRLTCKLIIQLPMPFCFSPFVLQGLANYLSLFIITFDILFNYHASILIAFLYHVLTLFGGKDVLLRWNEMFCSEATDGFMGFHLISSVDSVLSSMQFSQA